MAKDTNFPIYKPVYELLQIVTRLTGKFDKTFKYTLGDKLSQEAVNLAVLVFRAKSSKESITPDMLASVEVIELLCRLSKDLRQIDIKQFSEIVMLTDSIIRKGQCEIITETSLEIRNV